MKTAGEPKRVNLCTHLNYWNSAIKSWAWILSTPLHNKRIVSPTFFLMTFAFSNVDSTAIARWCLVSLVYILEFSSTMFEKTTVGRRAFWVKKCNGFTSQVIWFTSRGKKIVPSFRIHCVVKLECANSIYFQTQLRATAFQTVHDFPVPFGSLIRSFDFILVLKMFVMTTDEAKMTDNF